MPNVRVNIDITGYVEQVDQAKNRDIPFVTAKALTRVAQDGQTEMRRQAARKFHLRNTWTQQGIRFTPADKLSWPIHSEVFTDTSNGKTGAPDYLARQEDGGLKVPFGGRHYLAIPTKYLRAIAPGPIPNALRPRTLLPADAQIGQAYRGRFDGPYAGPAYGRLGVRRLRSIGSSQYVAFLQYDRRGTLCVFVRIQGQRDPQPWYILTPQATVKAVLEMATTVAKVVDERFETHWDDAWDAI